jgi:hypothetical protein
MKVGPWRRCLPISALLVLSACGTATEASPSGSMATTASVAASAAASPGASTSDSPTTFNIAWAEQDFEGSIMAVAADGERFVAAGGGADSRAAWTSTDGTHWMQHLVPDPAPNDCAEPDDVRCFPNSAPMGQLVRLQDTLYSIGITPGFNDYLRPVGWRWTDGQQWEAIQSDSPFYGFGQVTDLAASTDALVAIKSGATGFASGAWRWTAETSWVASPLAGTPGAPIDVYDATWGTNIFLAIGVSAEPVDDLPFEEWPTSPFLWKSTDGMSWNSVSPFPPSARPCSVTATSKGFVVLGDTDAGPAVWNSIDATTWVQVDLASAPGATSDPYHLFQSCAVTEVSGGLLATRGVADGTLTWLSLDGRAWTAGPTLDIITGPDSIAGVGDTVVMAGHRVEARSPEGAPPVVLVGTVQH